MNVGSLFSGIGGIDLGLERAGMRVLWQVECDPYARAVLRKHWPSAALYDDVRSVGAANLAPVDLVCGGFPCQDISNAGKRVGIDGERSGLWSEYARIVRELRPRYVLVENVAALLARGLERVVGDLAACGYDAEWDCFPAAAFGAPHRRDRLFVVAHAAVDRDPQPEQDLPLDHERQPSGRAEVSTDALRRDRARHVADAERDPIRIESGRRNGASWASASRPRFAGQDVANADLARLEGWHGDKLRERAREQPARKGGASPVPDANKQHVDDGRHGAGVFLVQESAASSLPRSDWWNIEPDVGRVAHGVPSRVDRLRCLGNAVVPQVAEWIGRQILAHAGDC